MDFRNSKSVPLDNGRVALTGYIGAVGYIHPETGEQVDIKPELRRIGDVVYVINAPYDASVNLITGAREFYPDKYDHEDYLKLPSVPLISNAIAPVKNILFGETKLGRQLLPNRVRMPFEWGHIDYIFTNTGMKFVIYFHHAPKDKALFGESMKVLLNIDSNLDISKLLKSSSGLGIPRPRIISTTQDLIEQDKWLDWSYKDGQLELGWDFGTLPFPLLLQNTTIDVTVDASADDGREYNGFDNAADAAYVGEYSGTKMDGFARWDTLSGLSGRQIDVAKVLYFRSYTHGDAANFDSLFYAEDAAAPTQIADLTDYNSRVMTSASVAQTGAWIGTTAPYQYEDSPSLISIIEELVGDYDPSAIQIFWKDNGSASLAYWQYRTYDYTGNATGPNLYIEHSVAPAEGFAHSQVVIC